MAREVLACHTVDGTEPFSNWLETLDFRTEAIALERIDRVERGTLESYSHAGEAVAELRIDFGPGYPVYFGQIGNSEGARIAVQVGTPVEDREERHRDTVPSIPCVRR